MFKESSQWTPAEYKEREKETVGRFLAILTFFLKSGGLCFYLILLDWASSKVRKPRVIGCFKAL